MDLRLQSRKWAGNIFQKLEALRHEVDDIVSQGTVKYVENQVQKVGENVKRFCSDAVQDLLPSSLVEPGKNEPQASSWRHNITSGTHDKSEIGTDEKPAHINCKEGSLERDIVHPVGNTHEQIIDLRSSPKSYVTPQQYANVLNLDNIVTETTTKKEPSTSGHLVSLSAEDKESLLSKSNDERYLGQCGDALNPDDIIEENYIKEEPSHSGMLTHLAEGTVVSEGSTRQESIERCRANEILVDASRTSLAGHEGLTRIQKNGTTSNHLTDESHGASETSSTLPSSEVISLFTKSNEEVHTSRPRHEVPSTTSVSQEGLKSAQTNEVACSHFEGDLVSENRLLQSSDRAETTKEGYADELLDEVHLASSDFPEGLKLTDKVGTTCSSLMHKDLYSSTTDEFISLTGSSGNRYEHSYEHAPLRTHISDLGIGESNRSGDDIAESVMETIDLSDKVKVDESCVIVDSKLLNAASSWPSSRKSYKKLIRDAFTSGRRLRKEYKQLAVMYGDIDEETGQQQSKQSLSPCTISSDMKKSPSHDLSDPEWELL